MDKPRHGCRLGSEQLDSCSAAEVLAENKLNMSGQGMSAAIRVNNALDA